MEHLASVKCSLQIHQGRPALLDGNMIWQTTNWRFRQSSIGFVKSRNGRHGRWRLLVLATPLERSFTGWRQTSEFLPLMQMEFSKTSFTWLSMYFRIGRKPIFFLCLFLNVFGRIFSLFVASNFYAFLLFQFITGTGFPMIFIAPCMICAEMADKGKAEFL